MAAGRFLRTALSNLIIRIMYEDLPNPDDLLTMCQVPFAFFSSVAMTWMRTFLSEYLTVCCKPLEHLAVPSICGARRDTGDRRDLVSPAHHYIQVSRRIVEKDDVAKKEPVKKNPEHTRSFSLYTHIFLLLLLVLVSPLFFSGAPCAAAKAAVGPQLLPPGRQDGLDGDF